ncbi:MAG: tRNA (adenosine(37)-N6)-threonylcarbamoyltransferase complex transferase subunit TsaD [Chlamydiae bacterium]|nr:tRNA (adenosine(37)-N6)-threonylcarbamoyltransferase complex transferase subunit TsaD [Chlamydiota bacterium]
MIVLGIESTCDETAAAVVKDGRYILSNVIASQVAIHQSYGGVFPELASRSHLTSITPVIEKALQEANVELKDIDLISVAKGPGLIGSLIVGLQTAKALAMTLDKPFVGVNHVEAHLYASMMHTSDPLLPALGVVVSGGHTFIVYIERLGTYTLLGTTVDDAIGEAFDKVAVMLKLPYPGGPAIESLAKKGNSNRFLFKAGTVKDRPLDFSFSGLKTNVYYMIHGQGLQPSILQSEEDRADLAASFQKTACKDIIKKCQLALEGRPCKAIYLGGGVSNNQTLHALFLEAIQHLPLFFPPFGLSLDNAAMIAGLGYHIFLQKNKQSDPLDLVPETRIPFNG